MTSRLRGAIFGMGHMGRLHHRKLSARDDVELIAIDPPRGLSAPRDLAVDFAIIAAPTTTHHAISAPLLDRGVPCLVEKPLAATLTKARDLARHPHLTVGHIERWNPALAPVLGVQARFLQAERLGPPRARRRGERGTDVDVVADLMIHDLDLVGCFLPPAEARVQAIGVGMLGGGADIVNARVERGGAVAVLTASRVSRQSVRKLRLFEEGTYWSIDLLARQVHRVPWGEGDLLGEPVPVPPGDALERQHAAFLDAVRGRASFPVPGAAGVAAMELAAAVRADLDASACAPC